MRIERLYLHNFRCFSEIDISFHPRLTVIVAENGGGKSAILDAISIAFGRFLTKLGAGGIATRETDLRVDESEHRSSFLALSCAAFIPEGERIVWGVVRKRDAAVKNEEIISILGDMTRYKLRWIDAYATTLVNNDINNISYILPVVAYYGTQRVIQEEVQRRRGFKKSFLRFDALVGALQPDARFRSAFEWFNAMEDQERRQKEERRDFDFRLPELDAVRSAIERLLPTGFSHPRTKIRPLRFVIDRHMLDGTVRTLRLCQLSDGLRAMLGLVMDLSRRMAQANPVANPLEQPAVVLIDEVDLHLHPKWQQRVMADLMRVFPNAQFIVTTHSPQLLTTVESEQIRILADNQVFSAPAGTKGAEASRLLKRVLGVEVRPVDDEATRQLNEYLSLVDEDLWRSERALELRRILDRRYQGEEPALLEADLRIENRQWELDA